MAVIEKVAKQIDFGEMRGRMRESKELEEIERRCKDNKVVQEVIQKIRAV